MESGVGNKRGLKNVVSNWQLRFDVDSFEESETENLVRDLYSAQRVMTGSGERVSLFIFLSKLPIFRKVVNKGF